MKDLDLDYINGLSFSASGISELPFLVCWMSATSERNTDNLNFRNHHHAFFELHFITKGYMEYSVDGRMLTVRAGEFILIAPSLLHRVVSADKSFTKLTLALNFSKEAEFYNSLTKERTRVAKTSKECRDELDKIISKKTKKSAYRACLAELSAIQAVIHSLESLGLVCALHKENSIDKRVIKAKMLIEDNTDIFFTCEELSGYCRISAKQLGRLFKKYEGIGLLEYIHRQKTEAAKRMLKELDLPKYRIAELLGFSDYRYFDKFFKRLTGKSCAEYISELRGTV